MCMHLFAGFWAPEMHGTDTNGRSKVYTSSVDFWSLGCLIFTLLTGKYVRVLDF